ncbi:hypothetical protein, partial [Actinomadura luteofluorescens]
AVGTEVAINERVSSDIGRAEGMAMPVLLVLLTSRSGRPGPPFLRVPALTCGRSVSDRTQYGKACCSGPPRRCRAGLHRTYYSGDLSEVVRGRVLPR